MNVTLIVDGESHKLPQSDFSMVDGVVTLSEKVKTQIREWTQCPDESQRKRVDIVVSYSAASTVALKLDWR